LFGFILCVVHQQINNLDRQWGLGGHGLDFKKVCRRGSNCVFLCPKTLQTSFCLCGQEFFFSALNMSHKRQRLGPVDITCVPDAVFHVIITFAESSLSQILALQRVNRHFRRMMRLPIMVSHLDLRLRRPADLLQLGPHAVGLRRVGFGTAQSLRLIKLAPSLRELDLSFCKTVTDANLATVCTLTQLRVLVIKGCPRLVDVSCLSAAPALKFLNMSNCVNIGSIPACDLVGLDMNGCSAVRQWDALRHMSSLTSLSMSGCAVTDQGLEHMPSGLRELNIAFGRELTDAALSNVARSPMLSTLNLSGCTKLTTLEPLATLRFMEDLRLVFCFGLQNIDALRAMPLLRVVHAPHSDLACEALRGGFVGLDFLGELDLSHTRTTHMAFDASLPSLRNIIMRSCYMLYNLEAIDRAASLRNLDLSGCSSVDDASVRSLVNLPHLRNLHLNSCAQLTDQGLASVGRILTLKRLGLYGCHLITDEGVRELAGLTDLHTLDLQGCLKVRDEGLHSLSGLYRMRCLNLSRCSLTDAGLFALLGMSELHSLNLDSCHKISDVGLRALSSLANLRQIVLSRCNRVQTLQPLSNLTQLTSINLSGCVRVTDVSLLNLTQCKQLRTINARHCKKITRHGVAVILALTR
jgi:Leucine-rich repeat (LRR) protein